MGCHYRVFRKRSIVLLVALFFLLSSLTACGSSKNDSDKKPSVDEITQNIKKSVNLSDKRFGDNEKLKKLYDIDSIILDGFVLFLAPSNIKADEVAIFKVKNSSDVSKVKDKISARIDKKSQSFKEYLPDEYYLIQHSIVKTNGNYVLFVVSKDGDKISDKFGESFK